MPTIQYFWQSAEELQSELYYFDEYCEKWNFKVNTNKSKVMFFSKGRLPINLNFKMNNMELEIVSEFIYLGTMFQRTVSFKKNKINLTEKASKAMYDILNKGRVHNLSVSCQLDLFDTIIIPMLTYGSEIWGYVNIDLLVKVHEQFCKLLLNLKTAIPNFMLYGELGRYPLNITVKLKILSFWSKLIDGKQSKLSFLIYRLLYLKTHGNNTFSWINFVKSILDYCDYSNVWHTENFISHKWLIESTKLRLTDQFKQNLHSTLHLSPKTLSYRLFKSDFRFEKYLEVLNDKNRFTFCRFRTSNHRLPIEVWRWTKVERHSRLCQLCQSHEIGDEFHYVLQCPNFVTERKNLIPKYFFNRPNALKLSSLFNKKKLETIRKLCKLIDIINKKISSP